MKSDDLAVFLAAAEAGSIGRAAEQLHTVQSAVTTCIRKLEGRLGVPLFRRHARGVALTVAGETMLPFASQITRLLTEARQAVVDGDTPRGRLLKATREIHGVPPCSCSSAVLPMGNRCRRE